MARAESVNLLDITELCAEPWVSWDISLGVFYHNLKKNNGKSVLKAGVFNVLKYGH